MSSYLSAVAIFLWLQPTCIYSSPSLHTPVDTNFIRTSATVSHRSDQLQKYSERYNTAAHTRHTGVYTTDTQDIDTPHKGGIYIPSSIHRNIQAKRRLPPGDGPKKSRTRFWIFLGVLWGAVALLVIGMLTCFFCCPRAIQCCCQFMQCATCCKQKVDEDEVAQNQMEDETSRNLADGGQTPNIIPVVGSNGVPVGEGNVAGDPTVALNSAV